MTDEETRLLMELGKCWNLFAHLPIQHPDALNEFRAKIHDLQCMVMSRPVEREINK